MKTHLVIGVLAGMIVSASAMAAGPMYAYSVPDQNGQPRQMTPDDWKKNVDGRAEDPNAMMSDRARAFRNGWVQRGDYDAQRYAKMYDDQQNQPPQSQAPLQSHTYVYSDPDPDQQPQQAMQPLPPQQAQQPMYDPRQIQTVDADQQDQQDQDQDQYQPPPQYAAPEPRYAQPPAYMVASPRPVYTPPPPPVQYIYQPAPAPTPVYVQRPPLVFAFNGYNRGSQSYYRGGYYQNAYRQAPRRGYR